MLDPYAGSGTTGVACLRLGRQFAGAERDDRYHALAKERPSTQRPAGYRYRASRAGQQSLFGGDKVTSTLDDARALFEQWGSTAEVLYSRPDPLADLLPLVDASALAEPLESVQWLARSLALARGRPLLVSGYGGAGKRGRFGFRPARRGGRETVLGRRISS